MSVSAAPLMHGQRVRVAWVGLNSWSFSCLNDSALARSVRVSAILEPEGDRVTLYRRESGRQPAIRRSWHKMFRDDAFDAVVIGRLLEDGPEIAEAALQAGKHLYVRPAALNFPEGLKKLSRIALANRLAFQYGLDHRSDVLYERVRTWLRSGLVGQISRAEAWWNSRDLPEESESIPERCLLLRADALRFLLDAPRPIECAASQASYGQIETPSVTPNFVYATYVLDDALRFSVTVSPNCQRRGFGELISGSKGRIAIINGENASIESAAVGRDRTVTRLSRSDLRLEALQTEDLLTFIKRIEGRLSSQPAPVAEEALEVGSMLGYAVANRHTRLETSRIAPVPKSSVMPG